MILSFGALFLAILEFDFTDFRGLVKTRTLNVPQFSDCVAKIRGARGNIDKNCFPRI